MASSPNWNPERFKADNPGCFLPPDVNEIPDLPAQNNTSIPAPGEYSYAYGHFSPPAGNTEHVANVGRHETKNVSGGRSGNNYEMVDEGGKITEGTPEHYGDDDDGLTHMIEENDVYALNDENEDVHEGDGDSLTLEENDVYN